MKKILLITILLIYLFIPTNSFAYSFSEFPNNHNYQRILNANNFPENQGWTVSWSGTNPTDTRSVSNGGIYNITNTSGQNIAHFYYPQSQKSNYQYWIRLRYTGSSSTSIIISNGSKYCDLVLSPSNIKEYNTTTGTLTYNYDFTKIFVEIYTNINNDNCITYINGVEVFNTTTTANLSTALLKIEVLNNSNLYITDIYSYDENFIPKSTPKILTYLSEPLSYFLIYSGSFATLLGIFILFYIGIKLGLSILRR